jgi:biopolymer transport protein ExbD
MQFSQVRKKRKRVIGVTPLIDIVFILLIFFILETTLVEFKAVDINFPIANSDTQSVSSGRQLIIEVFDENRLWVTGVKIDIDQLAGHISSLKLDSSTVVRLEVAKNVRLQLLVNVLDVLNAKNMGNISVARIE